MARDRIREVGVDVLVGQYMVVAAIVHPVKRILPLGRVVVWIVFTGVWPGGRAVEAREGGNIQRKSVSLCHLEREGVKGNLLRLTWPLANHTCFPAPSGSSMVRSSVAQWQGRSHRGSDRTPWTNCRRHAGKELGHRS
jgi:hypothetical protein